MSKPLEALPVVMPSEPISVTTPALGEPCGAPPDIARRRPRPRRVDVEPLADSRGGPAAIFDPLDPAKDLLGVGLADAEGEHA